LPVIVATAVFEEVKVQAPNEFDVGGTKATLATDPRIKFRSAKGPVVGDPPVIVTVVALLVAAQLKFALCIAVNVTVPIALGVKILPEIEAIAEFEVVKLQVPAEVDVGAVRVIGAASTPKVIEAKFPRVGIAGRTVSVVLMLFAS
jgi:hypothetical protein